MPTINFDTPVHELTSDEYESVKYTDMFARMLKNKHTISLKGLSERDRNFGTSAIKEWCRENVRHAYYFSKCDSQVIELRLSDDTDNVNFKMYWDGREFPCAPPKTSDELAMERIRQIKDAEIMKALTNSIYKTYIDKKSYDHTSDWDQLMNIAKKRNGF